MQSFVLSGKAKNVFRIIELAAKEAERKKLELLAAIKEQDKVNTQAEKERIIKELSAKYQEVSKANWNIGANNNLPKWIREVLNITKVKPQYIKREKGES